jgi:hypothetical protein
LIHLGFQDCDFAFAIPQLQLHSIARHFQFSKPKFGSVYGCGGIRYHGGLGGKLSRPALQLIAEILPLLQKPMEFSKL